MQQKVIVIGAGFAGLSAAALLAQAGHQVTLVEKHDHAGGRARQWKKDGFTFDMGPSWYWMPDVFEEYFGLFGKRVEDYYTLKRLSPSYRVYFGQDDFVDIPANMGELEALFESLEPGSVPKLEGVSQASGLQIRGGYEGLCTSPFPFYYRVSRSTIAREKAFVSSYGDPCVNTWPNFSRIPN